MAASVARESLRGDSSACVAGQVASSRRRDGALFGRSLRADERLWLGGLALLVLCSWGRWLATGSLKVDESYPSEALGTLLLAGLAAGLGMAVLGWKGLLERPVRDPRRLAFTGLALSALMLPMLSNDVFSLLTYGSLAGRGEDVFTTSAALHDSAWFSWIGARWAQSVCVYGPTTLVTLVPAGLLGSHAGHAGNAWLALLTLRLTWLLPLVVVMELSFRRFADRPFFHAMVWLNPLFVLEGPGQLHTDLLGVIAVVAGFLFQERGRVKSSWGMYALAVLGKYSFALTGPWFWLAGARTTRERLVRLPAMALVTAPLAVAVFAPFWRGMATILIPAHALTAMNPGGTLTELFGHIVQLARGGSVNPPELPIAQAATLDRLTHETSWMVASCVLGVISLSVATRVLRTMLRRASDDDTIALGTGILVVLVATIASRRFEPWYLMAALPFFGLRCTDDWRRWWVAAVAFSIAPTFINVLPRSAMILPVWSVVTIVGLGIVFLSAFRPRYLSFGEEGAELEDERGGSGAILGVNEDFGSAIGE